MTLAAISDAENQWHRDFVTASRQTGIAIKDYEAQNASPVQKINDVLQLGAMTVKIEVGEHERILGRHPNADPIGFSRLSDGERNAVLLAAEVVTSSPDTVLLIDEPERHLSRAITEPLLGALFRTRKDCSFVIATHEIALPAAFTNSRTLVVRGCSWQGEAAEKFDLNVLEPNTDLPYDLRRAILGARKRILFVEGDQGSLDSRLYQLLFPSVSVAPKGSCVDVIRAVGGLRGAEQLHWVEAFGLVDRDNRSDDEVATMQGGHVFALMVCSVESLFYGSVARRAMAASQGRNLGKDPTKLLLEAESSALAALDDQAVSSHLCALRCERQVRDAVLAKLPKAADLALGLATTVNVDPTPLIAAECAHFAQLRSANDLVL